MATGKGLGGISPKCAQPQSTHLHEALLHVGSKIPQDTQLRLQGPRHSTHREGEVLCVGGIVLHSPGGRRQRSEGTQHQFPFPERLQAPKPRSTHQGAALLVIVVWIQGTP